MNTTPVACLCRIGFLLALAAPGCAAAQREKEGDRLASGTRSVGAAASHPATEPSGPHAQHPSTQPAGRSLTAAELMPLKAESGRFAIIQGLHAGQTVPYAQGRVADGTWKWTLEGVRSSYSKETSDGGVVVLREEEIGENVATSYDPPLVSMPAKLTQGEPVRHEAHMTVKNLKTGRVREQGTVTSIIELLGRRKVETPAGEFDAYIVRETRDMRLKLATVRVVVDTAYALGIGEVGEQVTEQTRALGLLGGDKHEEMRLAK